MKLKTNVNHCDISSNSPFMRKRPTKSSFPTGKYFARLYYTRFKFISVLHGVDLHKAQLKSLRYLKSVILSKAVIRSIFTSHTTITTVSMQIQCHYLFAKTPLA